MHIGTYQPIWEQILQSKFSKLMVETAEYRYSDFCQIPEAVDGSGAGLFENHLQRTGDSHF